MSEEQKQTVILLDFCPHCAAQTEQGFGLAGGGYGPYCYCPNETCIGYFAKIRLADDEA